MCRLQPFVLFAPSHPRLDRAPCRLRAGSPESMAAAVGHRSRPACASGPAACHACVATRLRALSERRPRMRSSAASTPPVAAATRYHPEPGRRWHPESFGGNASRSCRPDLPCCPAGAATVPESPTGKYDSALPHRSGLPHQRRSWRNRCRNRGSYRADHRSRGSATGVVLDVTDPASCVAAAEFALRTHGRLDVIWANAGVSAFRPVKLMDPASWRRVIEINLLGAYNLVQAALPHIIATQGYAAFTASGASFAHSPGHSAYAASKAGLEAPGIALRTELAENGVGLECSTPCGSAPRWSRESRTTTMP